MAHAERLGVSGMAITVGDLAEKIGTEVEGDRSLRLKSLATPEKAESGDLTFAENEEFLEKAEQSAASAILTGTGFTSSGKTVLKAKSPRVAFAKVVPLFFPEPRFSPGIHPTSQIDPSANIPETAHVGPHCQIGPNVRLGAHTVLRGGNHVGADCELGDEAHLFPGVVIYPGCHVGERVRIHANTVIGSDGFGYVMDGERHLKVPQIGNVVVECDVEIGANVTIDCGTLGSTVIGRGTKIDNLVMIAHNVEVGENCILVAQAAIAGSTELGNFVTLAGQVGIAGHIKIADQATVAAQSGVMHNIGKGETWFGSPAQPSYQTKRQLLAQQQLPELLRRVKKLESQLEGLNSAGAESAP